MANAGNYTVTLSKYVDGVVTDLAGPEKFFVKILPGTTLPAANRPALVEWQRKAAELQRSMAGASAIMVDANNRTRYMKEAVFSVEALGWEDSHLAQEQGVDLLACLADGCRGRNHLRAHAYPVEIPCAQQIHGGLVQPDERSEWA